MADTKSAFKTILNRNVLLIFAIQFFQNISAVMGGTFVGPLGKATGLSVALIGTAGTIYTLSGMFMRGPAARMTDGDKRKIALVAGIGGRGVVYLLMGVFQNNPMMYMVLRCLQGVTWSLIGVALVSSMAVIVDKKVMGTAYAIFNAMLSIGKIFAKPFAQKLYMDHGFMTVATVTFGAAMIATVLIFFLDFDTPAFKNIPPRKQKSLNPFSGLWVAAVPIALIGGLAKLGYTTDNLFTSIMTVERGLDPTAAYAVGGTIATVVGLVVGVLCDIIGAKWVLVTILAFNGIGLAMMGTVQTQTALMIAYILYTGFGGKYDSPIKILAMKAAPKEKQGAAQATILLFNDVFSAIAGTVIGLVAQSGGYEMSYMAVGIVSGACALAVMFFSRWLLAPLSAAVTAEAQPVEK